MNDSLAFIFVSGKDVSCLKFIQNNRDPLFKKICGFCEEGVLHVRIDTSGVQVLDDVLKVLVYVFCLYVKP